MERVRLVIGGAGSGKTTMLLRRTEELTAQGEPWLAVGFSSESVRRSAERMDGTPRRGSGVLTCGSLALGIVRETATSGLGDPLLEPFTFTDRLALLLDRIEDLPLRSHDVRGDPVGVLTGVLRRIDQLKGQGRDAAAIEALAAAAERKASAGVAAELSRREREFAELVAIHDRLLREAGTVDRGQLVLDATRLARAGGWGARPAPHLLVDELETATRAERALVEELASCSPSALLAIDDAAAPRGLVDGVAERLEAEIPEPLPAPGLSQVQASFWACASEAAQAQAIAVEVEVMVAAGTAPPSIAVCVRSAAREGRAIASALSERSVPAAVSGATGFFGRAEVRDAVAWLRLLADPADAAAVSRALVRAPVELRAGELARCTAIARRRKVDMVSALEAALESPQLQPEGRDRVAAFLRLHRAAAAAFEEMSPDLFVQRLIDRMGLRRGQLFSAHPDAVERLVNLSRLATIASAWLRRHPGGSCREFARWAALACDLALTSEEAPPEERSSARHAVLVGEESDLRGARFAAVFVAGIAGNDRARLYRAGSRATDSLVLCRVERGDDGAPLGAASAYTEAMRGLGAEEERREDVLFGPGEELHSTFRMIRDESLEEAWRAAGSLGELRLDTDLDVERSIARHLEMLKLAALLQRPEGQSIEDALRLADEALDRVATPEQRRLLRASALDEHVLDAEAGARRRSHGLATRNEPSLEAFIPRKGPGLALSAGDIDLYRTCPLKYKFGRVFAIPQEPTINQRFGIVLHQVLERFHSSERCESLGDLLGLFDASWRRGGFGKSDEELQFRDRAVSALTRFHEREANSPSDTVMVEEQFALAIGPHQVRGRVDRVDRLPSGEYEVIDYKTGRHKTDAELRDDVQLALYRLAARSAWAIDPGLQSYWYVIDDEKVTLRAEPGDGERVERAVLETAQGIEAQDFEPRPSWSVCSWCDYRSICPAAEV